MAKINGNGLGQGLEALAVRRTAMADADKVRYRVYRTPTEFIAVIAESALMAVKVSGIAEPLRIVRDLPTEGVAIHAERMVSGDSGQRVNLGLEKPARETQYVATSADPGEPKDAFVPMRIRDLDQKRGRAMRILSPQDLETITAALPPRASQAQEPAAPTPIERVVEVMPEPTSEPAATSDTLTPDQVAALLNE